MSVSQATLDIVEESVESSALVLRNGFPLEPRCRICRNDSVRRKVNDLLTTGASYAMIVRALAADNAELDKCDRVTIDSVRNHCGRHFPVQNVAKATYREILERRAKANSVDFVEGVASRELRSEVANGHPRQERTVPLDGGPGQQSPMRCCRGRRLQIDDIRGSANFVSEMARRYDGHHRAAVKRY